MSDPLVPNYKKDVGRLATDRYDFEDHIEGNNFRHKAGAVDVFPTLVIGTGSLQVTATNVQEALSALNNVVTPPVIQDATLVTKGIVQLAGDIGGVATDVVVTRIQTNPISTLPPSAGDVLTWDGTNSVWKPSPATNAFSAAGDLAGNNVLQQVIGLTGDVSGIVTASCNVVNFLSNKTPLFTQNTVTSGVHNFTIRAQSASGASQAGASVIIAGGKPGSGGVRGGVKLQMTSALPSGYPTTAQSPVTAANLLQLAEPAAGRRVLALCDANDLTSLDMPTDTGDMVIYIRDTATPPVSGSPSNGTIVYSSGGQLWIKQQDGNQFSVGTIPNPSVWGSSGQQTITYRDYVTSGASAATARLFNLPDQTATRADVIFIGKKVGGADSAQFNLSIGYVRHGGAPAVVGSGTPTNADPRTTAGASGWTIPTINVSGNNLQVLTGFSGSTNINWLVITQLTMSQG